MEINNQGQTPRRSGQWQKVKDLPDKVISDITSRLEENHFSLEVRDFLTEWIEAQYWDLISDEATANNFLSGMVQEINKCSRSQPFSTKRKLEKSAIKIEEHYKNDSLKFVHFIESILKWELLLLEGYGEETETDPCQQSVQTQDWTEQLNQLEDLLKKNQRKIQEASSLVEFDAGNLNPERKKQQIRKGQDSKSLKTEISKEEMIQSLQEPLAFLDSAFPYLENTTKDILDKDLQNWIRKQRLYGNPSETDEIDKIREWCSKIALLIRMNQQQIQEISQLSQTNYHELNDSLTRLYRELLRRTFIVLKQPHQITKVKKCMDTSVCFLSGREALDIGNSNPPTVTAELISKLEKEVKGTLKNNRTMQWDQNLYVATFKEMRLMDVKRTNKPEKSVTEEKFFLQFSMKIKVGEEEELLQVLSLPVVVITNVSIQESKAEGTILWDNFFADHIPPGETEVPEKVLWPLWTDMLNYKFKKDIGVSLKPEHFKYFAPKIFDKTFDDLSTVSITWDQFWKRNMTDKEFSFWEWFHAIERLIQGYFLPLYKGNLIMGFVERSQAEQMLRSKKYGTFLLRFSDNRLGALSVARRASADIQNHIPYTSEEFKKYTLPKLVLSQKKLLYVYPDIPKQEFQKYDLENTNIPKQEFKKCDLKSTNGDQFMEKLGYMKKHGYTKLKLDIALDSYSDDEENNTPAPSLHSNSSPEQMDTEPSCLFTDMLNPSYVTDAPYWNLEDYLKS